MQRTINKIPDQSLLNTAQWKHIVPQLYKQYPDKDMELNISVSSPPIIRVANNGIDFTVYSDVTIGVVDDDEVISVACISLVCFIGICVLISFMHNYSHVCYDFPNAFWWCRRFMLHVLQRSR